VPCLDRGKGDAEHDLTLERPRELGLRVTVSQADAIQVSVRPRLLGHDGCEFESAFDSGELISIHLCRFGSIRARITSRHGTAVEAECINDWPFRSLQATFRQRMSGS
jgi:hypothetical protein